MRKRILSLVAVIMLFAATGMAQDQDQKKGRPDPSQRIEKMITELGLTEEQATQFKEVMSEMMPARMDRGQRPPRPEMGEGSDENVTPPAEGQKPSEEDMQAKREEMKAKMAEMDEKIKAILTDEQYQKYQEMLPKRPQGKPAEQK